MDTENGSGEDAEERYSENGGEVPHPESEEQYRKLVELAPVGILINQEERIVFANGYAANLLGAGTAEEVVGISTWQVVHPEYHGSAALRSRRVLENGESVPLVEERFVCLDGREIAVEVTATPMVFKGRPATLVAFRDVTEREKLAQERIRLERLQALREMAAGISHNLNNLLTTVLGPAQLLRRATADPALLREVQDIVDSTERAVELVRRLNEAASAEPDLEVSPVSVNEVVEAALHKTRACVEERSKSRGISIDVDTGEACKVKANPDGLCDVVVNLILNALDAMPGGGRLFLGTEAVEGKVVLTVADTGVGMDEETRRRIFEPFFTTKANVGTGLGLYTVHETVLWWGGRVEVDSLPDWGTTFRIYLPAYD